MEIVGLYMLTVKHDPHVKDDWWRDPDKERK
jgi:hypothetical protein